MFRLFLLSFAILHFSPTSVLSRPGNLPTVFSPVSVTPVEVLRSPVTRVETLNFAPVARYSTPSASAFAVASTSSSSLPVSRIESYSSGDSSNGEIRDLLRSLLSELRNGGGRPSATVTLSAPSSSYSTVGDSYAAPPRNTVTDPNSPTYPDSISIARKPEKVQVQQVVFQEQQQQSTPVVAVSSVSSPQVVREIVRTVYQPVYVPVQVSQPQQEVQYQSVNVVSAVPTTIKTGASAVAFSTVHEQPAYAIQQQQAVVPVVQQYQQVQEVQQVQQVALSSGYSSGGYQTVLEGGYKKKK
ncbi:unnamed protein product [Orchesella dallaii]|uniref:Uncharacterized protein n=1 Tax=Orchesella dallaii TaxID=48710 RepID=A0ABP1RSW9_9HEXA